MKLKTSRNISIGCSKLWVCKPGTTFFTCCNFEDNLLQTAQKLKSSIEDATDVEDLKNTNEMKAESTRWNGKATAVLSGPGSCTDQDCEREKGSSGNSKILNPVHLQQYF